MRDWQKTMGWACRAVDPTASRWPSFIDAAEGGIDLAGDVAQAGAWWGWDDRLAGVPGWRPGADVVAVDLTALDPADTDRLALVAVHEYAHCVLAPRLRAATARLHRAAGREYTPEQEARALADAPPPRRTRADLMRAHGADFLRLCVHAAARLSRFAVFPVSPDDIAMGLQSPLARAVEYAAWLGDEPARLAWSAGCAARGDMGPAGKPGRGGFWLLPALPGRIFPGAGFRTGRRRKPAPRAARRCELPAPADSQHLDSRRPWKRPPGGFPAA